MKNISKVLILSLGVGLSPFALAKATTTAVPKFSLAELGKPAHKLTHANLPNKPFLLTAWASWCGACREENYYLKTLSQQDVTIVGINNQDEATDAKKFLKRHGNSFVFSIQDDDGQFTEKLDTPVLPYTLVIDGKGKIRGRVEGQLDSEVFDSQIKPCLSALNQNASEVAIKKASR